MFRTIQATLDDKAIGTLKFCIIRIITSLASFVYSSEVTIRLWRIVLHSILSIRD